MSYLRQERAAKLAMMESIAASQQALARMLHCIADISSYSDSTAKSLAENIRLLTQYQGQMAFVISGIEWQRQHYGTPSLPWFNEACDAVWYAVRGVLEGSE
ncbi:hypothetical protein Q5741_11250 [Paenibacillus sp. JX-17]|uniref:Uncharacterized protein n=1 Tax=Paenibacillus lacisoli TaxID=3064525 RepID=A0ABT9CCK1_9BACL|nr:hypothetical protein [Paenibacillus sp. JX-17]MDO7906992.1 hypothetical protein [Paenibacillus sp. JX-17]